MSRTVGRRAAMLLAVVAAVGAPAAGAQQVLVIDTAAGRPQVAVWGDDRGGVTLSSAANRVSLHPLRRVSGERCPGMLPSVGAG